MSTELEQAIARLHLEDGDVVFFDCRVIDIEALHDFCLSASSQPNAPNVTFLPVKLMRDQRIQDIAFVVPKANITVKELD